eukprot:316423-Ditylum_brightwellii.AAC.1
MMFIAPPLFIKWTAVKKTSLHATTQENSFAIKTLKSSANISQTLALVPSILLKALQQHTKSLSLYSPLQKAEEVPANVLPPYPLHPLPGTNAATVQEE